MKGNNQNGNVIFLKAVFIVIAVMYIMGISYSIVTLIVSHIIFKKRQYTIVGMDT